MTHAFVLNRPYLPASMRDAAVFDSLAAAIHAFPPVCRTGFELTLGAAGTSVQGLFFATTRAELRSGADAGAWHVPAWLDGQPDTAEIWFEMDIDRALTRPDASSAHNAFVTLSEPTPIHRALAGVPSTSKPGHLLAAMKSQLAEDAQAHVGVTDIGWFSGRARQPARVNLAVHGRCPRVLHQVAPGLPDHGLDMARRWMQWANDNGCRVVLAISEPYGSNLALELRPSRHDADAMRRLLARLVDAGLALPDQVDALLRWPGVLEPRADNVDTWPVQLMLMGMTAPRDRGIVIERVMSHVKLALCDNEASVAKAYFGYRPACVRLDTGQIEPIVFDAGKQCRGAR